MRRSLAIIVVLAMGVWLRPAAPDAAPLRTGPPRKHNPNARPATHPGIVHLAGQVVVMEGDDEIVTDYGGGGFGLDSLEAIGQRFYMHYGDDFDAITVFTTFADQASGGFAYALLLDHGFSGAGYMGGYSPTVFGSAGRLMSVTAMNNVAQYNEMDESDNLFFTVMGQEFGHSWLAFATFIDPVSTLESTELLGRDNSHWSATFDAQASVMDGVEWTDNGDGTFTAGQNSVRYGRLDLWAMGILRDDEVGDMFVIRNAVYLDGSPVGRTDHLGNGVSPGTVVRGDKFVFTIADVIAAGGPRVPTQAADNEDFRMAFILITKPGETIDDVQDQINKLNVGRLTWEAKHREWTNKRSTMCTDIEATCPLAFAAASNPIVTEDPDDSDGDGVIEPGEKVRVEVTFTNDGAEAATTAIAEITSTSSGVNLPDAITLPEIPVNGSIQHVFYLTIKGETCGNTVDLDITASIDHRIWRTAAFFQPGVQDNVEPETFATDAGWIADPAATDDATNGAWEYGVPEATYFAGRTLQPDGGADGAGDGAWFTGPTDPWNLGEVQGTTTLESADFDLTGVFAPTLQYKVWYLALDRTQSSLTNATGDHLVVQASDDGGETWVEIDRVGNQRLRWDTREAALVDKIESTATVRFRFIVTDDKDSFQRLVEIGIDDIAIISLSTSCTGDGGGGGCGCSLERKQSPSGTWMVLLFGLGLIVERRRRRRRRARL